MPVLDNGNKFLGIITAQSVIEVVDDEMGEDYAKLAGLTAEEDLKEGAAAAQHAKAFAVAVCPARTRHFGIDGRRRV